MAESALPSSPRRKRLPVRALAFAAGVGLALCLIAANIIHMTLLYDAPTLDGAAGELLYVSAFSGFADEWDLYDGQQSAKFVDEQLELTVASPQTATWSAARHTFRDFDLSVRATVSQGPVDNAFGVIFHARDRGEGDCDLPAIILCEADRLLPLAGAALRQLLPLTDSRGHYAFLISSDGYYSLWKTEGGTTERESDWIDSPHIRQGLGAENTLRVVARDTTYRFFINGAQVSVCIPNNETATSTYSYGECIEGAMLDAYQDARHPAGKLGLIAQSTATGGGGVGVRFDNLVVLSPAAPGDEDAKA